MNLVVKLYNLYDELYSISKQDFYNLMRNNIGVIMRIVCFISLMKKEKLSESENHIKSF